jgi:hypothetical protein
METNKCTHPVAIVQAMQSIKNHTKPYFCEVRDRVSGWIYKSEFELNLCERQVIFRVYTSKRDGNICSTLTGHRLSSTGSMIHVMGYGHQGDFSQMILRESNKRATRSLLLAKHIKAIELTGALGGTLAAYYRQFFTDKAMSDVMEYI